jgi:hypothetical protein
MASPLNVTKIPAPRVPLIDERTGYISREWYRFFLNLFDLTGSGSNPTSIDEILIGPPNTPVDFTVEINNLIPSGPSDSPLMSQIAEIDKQLLALASTPSNESLLSQIVELQKQINGLQAQPIIDVGAIAAAISNLTPIPVTKTADFTVGAGETWIINNKSGSTCTVTLPTASSYPGRVLTFQNYQAQFLVSASSNVVPLGGGAAGTAVLENVAGNWATLVSNNTNWVTMQEAPNNALLIE